MKKFFMILSMLMMTATAQAAFTFQGAVVVGPYLNCSVGNNTVMPYRVISIQYTYSCQDIYGGVWTYNPAYTFNDIYSYVNPGTVKTFPGPSTTGCRVIAAACTVLAE